MKAKPCFILEGCLVVDSRWCRIRIEVQTFTCTYTEIYNHVCLSFLEWIINEWLWRIELFNSFKDNLWSSPFWMKICENQAFDAIHWDMAGNGQTRYTFKLDELALTENGLSGTLFFTLIFLPPKTISTNSDGAKQADPEPELSLDKSW